MKQEILEKSEQQSEQQVDRLAKFILGNDILGEPSRSEGAVDVSIRLHRVLIQSIATLSTMPGYTHMTLREVMDSQKKLSEEI